MADPKEVLGSGISKGVTDQLLLRENLIGQSIKDKNHLLFFNSNGAWVRLASSINIVTQDQAKKLAGDPSFKEYSQNSVVLQPIEDIRGSNQIAEKNVLFGGMYPDKQKPSGGISQTKWHKPTFKEKNVETQEELLKLGSTKSRNYHNYESLGYRPTPGITAISVQSKNTYGTLREAQVNITVWTVEDLELMQTLYLRPGYSMLLEWGHSLGLNVDKTLNSTINVYRKFLQGYLSQEQIEKDLLKLTEDANYNYDAMYGYVSNFSWSFRQDGGYDCTLKIISKGSIIESLALTFDSSKTYPSKELTEENKEKTKEERKSIFHKFKHVLQESDVSSYSTGGTQFPNGRDSKAPTQGFFESDERYAARLAEFRSQAGNLFPVDVQYEYNLNESGADFTKNLNPFVAFILKTDQVEDRLYQDRRYVPFRTILDIYNIYITITDPTGTKRTNSKSDGYAYVQFYTGWQDAENTENYERKSKFITSNYHFSINPKVCLLIGQMYDRGLEFFGDNCNPVILNKTEKDLPNVSNIGIIQKSNLDLAVQAEFRDGGLNGERIRIKGEEDDILNILISLDHITDILDQIIEEDKNSDQNTSNNMTTFLQRLLQDINKSLGGVNDLDIFYDESQDINYIVDRRLTPTEPDKVPILSLAGINSTITDLNISSKISSNIANQVSIAAQAGNGGAKDNIGPLLQWNRGLIDRHFVNKDTNKPSTKDTSAEKDRLTKWLEDYVELWLPFKVIDRTHKQNYQLAYTTSQVSGGSRQLERSPENAFTDIQPLESYHKQYCQKYVTELYFQGGTPKPPPGTIPVELSFTTIGIAGLKIGQSFRFKRGVLPEFYSDNFGFIITGLEHNVSGNRWTTNVKTLFFCLTPPPEFVIEKYKQVVGVNCPPYIPPPTGPLLPDPAVEINGTEKVGSLDAKATPVYQAYKIDLRRANKEQVLSLVRQGTLVEIGNANTNPADFAGNLESAKLLDGKFYLQSTAATAFFKWQQEVKSRGIPFQITSAVRFGQNTGSGPHGYGIAVDINSLFQAVGGSENPTANLNGRIGTPDYRTIAEIGKKYDWYNPWRLSDQFGQDELWHFEYWGPA